MRERGAIAWKVMVAVVATAGGIWAATQLSSRSPTDEAVPDVAGETSPARVTQAVQSGAPSAQSAPTPSQHDPFAGVDLTSSSVLRHITGIEEKARAKLGAAKRTPPVAALAEPVAAQRDAPSIKPARQETATEPRARTVPTAAPPPAAAPATVDALRPVATAAPAPIVAAAPPAQAETLPAAAPLKLPTAAPASAAAPPGDRTPLAAARIEPPPQVAPSLRIVNRTVPEFPGEAIRAGVQSGRVVARLTIDADGRVTGTQLLSASPTGFFERESRRALSTWRYEPTGRQMTTDVELVFTRE